jgi:radical SAM-linked protein
LRFLSHRDFQRSLERAVRRAGVPIAFSSGFTPHPRISYAGAAPTGAASEAEYFELGLAAECEPAWIASVLDAALPAGLDIVEVVPADGGALADRLEASEWEVSLEGVTAAEASASVEQLLALESVEVQRLTKKGVRRLDARAQILHLVVQPAGERAADTPGAEAASATVSGLPCAILHLVVRHATPAVRPDDVLTAMRTATGIEWPVPPKIRRLAQGPVLASGVGVGDPLRADRAEGEPT